MRGEIFDENVVHRRIEPSRIRDVRQAADDVVRIAFALAAKHRITPIQRQRLAIDFHLTHTLALPVACRERDDETFEPYEPSAEALRWILRKGVLQLGLEPVTNLSPGDDTGFEDRIDRQHAP